MTWRRQSGEPRVLSETRLQLRRRFCRQISLGLDLMLFVGHSLGVRQTFKCVLVGPVILVGLLVRWAGRRLARVIGLQ
jgi:hypothetical protein